jgi:hypothetical protein
MYFHRIGNLTQLCQNFGISGSVQNPPSIGTPLAQTANGKKKKT